MTSQSETSEEIENIFERRASTKARLETMLRKTKPTIARKPILVEYNVRPEFRIPLEETHFPVSGISTSAPDNLPSPTQSMNLMSFEDLQPQFSSTELQIRRGSNQMEMSMGDPMRKTIVELQQKLSRRSTQGNIPDIPSPSSWHTKNVPTTIENHEEKKRRYNLLRQESRSEPTALFVNRNTPGGSDSMCSQNVAESEGNLDVAAQRVTQTAQTLNLNFFSDIQNHEPPCEVLKMQDRVVWLLDKNAQTGIVEWIGEIDCVLMAGVHFENQIGHTDGILHGVQYFHCARNHGGFIPVQALIKYDDYYCNEYISKDSNAVSSKMTNPFSKPNVYPTRFSDWKSFPLFSCKDDPASQKNEIQGGEEDLVIICVICQEPLMTVKCDNSGKGGQSSKGMVTTSCGHLFHAFCLNKWFHTKPDQFIQECPYCNKTMNINSTIRIFPVLGNP